MLAEGYPFFMSCGVSQFDSSASLCHALRLSSQSLCFSQNNPITNTAITGQAPSAFAPSIPPVVISAETTSTSSASFQATGFTATQLASVITNTGSQPVAEPPAPSVQPAQIQSQPAIHPVEPVPSVTQAATVQSQANPAKAPPEAPAPLLVSLGEPTLQNDPLFLSEDQPLTLTSIS